MKQTRTSKAAFLASLGLLVSLSMAHAGSIFDVGAQDHFIIGGERISNSDPIASTTVAILNFTGKNKMALCTGSIVAPDLVVTAAHCVGPNKKNMRIVFRQNIIDGSEGPVVAVSDFVAHPRYGKARGEQDNNDIALVRFEGGLPRGYTVARLLPRASALANGVEVVLAGFGRATENETKNPAEDGSGVLRKVEVTVKDASFGRTEVLVDQSEGRGACHGDSGGPAFIEHNGRYYLFGVTSRGLVSRNTEQECMADVVYTNILAQIRFVKAAAKVLREQSRSDTRLARW